MAKMYIIYVNSFSFLSKIVKLEKRMKTEVKLSRSYEVRVIDLCLKSIFYNVLENFMNGLKIIARVVGMFLSPNCLFLIAHEL